MEFLLFCETPSNTTFLGESFFQLGLFGIYVVKQSQIAIIGVPPDLGASRRGVDMGPSAIRVAGLKAALEKLGYNVKDLGNIRCNMDR